MSQKKVDAYKAQKANRKETIKKEKRMLFLEKTAAAVVGLACVVWIGYSGYGMITGSKAAEENAVVETTEVDTTALDDMLNDISSWGTELEEAE